MTRRRKPSDETLRSRIETVASGRAAGWLVVAYLLVMFGTMFWVTAMLDRSMRHLTGRAIGLILEGNVAKFRLHVVTLQRDAEQQLARPELVDLVAEICETPQGNEKAGEFAGKERDELARLITRPPETLAWILVNAEGFVVGSDDAEFLSRDCRWSDANRRALRTGRSALVLPPTSPENAFGPCLIAMTPVMKTSRFVGALGWMIDARDHLSDRFEMTDADATYLFDRRARILSRSRLEVAARRGSGNPTEADRRLPDHANENLKQNGREKWTPVLVKDPGFDIRPSVDGVDQGLAAEELARRPLTVMADKATRGASGIDVNGYNDYRGVPVVGGWQWLSDLNVGMAMEIDQSEAFGAIRMLQSLVIGLLLLLTVAGIGVAALAMWSQRLRRRLRERQRGTRRLGQYELKDLLGAGGMGSVYRGRHQYLRRDVAIKVLEGDDLSPYAVERFRREVQLTSTLRHPNTIAIYDYGQAHRLLGDTNDQDAVQREASDADSVFYYVMEYVDGVSLQQLIDYYGPQHPARVIHLLLQIGGSIAEAHDAGLIHRDIKPANILLSAQSNSWDFIKVLDFGLVKDLGKLEDTVEVAMTRSDSITGTPLYMAPETIRDAGQASKQGDLYSIGAVGYALLTGHTTYDGDSAIDLCLKQLENPPPRPDVRIGRSLPDGLQNVIMSCLALDPKERPASMNELIRRLDDLPEAGCWNQADASLWWETVFEANRQKTPVETKNPTLAGC